MAATLKDIAIITGFSITTVSRALNGYSDVNEKTRLIIQTAAKKIDYVPNILARSLVMQQSKTIGFIITGLQRENIKDSFNYEILCGISDCSTKLQYECVILSTTTSKQRNKTYTQLCSERQLDGVIIQGLKMDDPYLHEAINSKIPCVLIDIPVDGDNLGFVTSNQSESVKNAIKYLHIMGHRNICYVNGSSHAHVSKIRKDAYLKSLQECGLLYKKEYVVNGDFSEEKARQVIIPLLLNHPEITAVFCASDIMALGVLRAARELGLNVPNQLSIVGFDNILLSQYVTPSITTIAQNPYEMGIKSTEILIKLINGDNSVVRKHELINEFILRDSVSQLFS
jgi:LacI family transcriptional regulator